MIQERERKAVGEAGHPKARADGTQWRTRFREGTHAAGRKAEYMGREAGRSRDLVVGGEGKKKKAERKKYWNKSSSSLQINYEVSYYLLQIKQLLAKGLSKQNKH